MNNNLLNIVKRIIAEHGDSILSDPKRVSAFFADLARDEPKPQKNALVKSLEHGFARFLQNAAEAERADCKRQLAQRLSEAEGFGPELCAETLDLLEAALFGAEPKKNLCASCGKEMQEGWKSCPYCLPSPARSSQAHDTQPTQYVQQPQPEPVQEPLETGKGKVLGIVSLMLSIIGSGLGIWGSAWYVNAVGDLIWIA